MLLHKMKMVIRDDCIEGSLRHSPWKLPFEGDDPNESRFYLQNPRALEAKTAICGKSTHPITSGIIRRSVIIAFVITIPGSALRSLLVDTENKYQHVEHAIWRRRRSK